MFHEQGTYWLNIVNIALGIGVSAGFLWIVLSVLRSAAHNRNSVRQARH
jgi:hypothetical protein